MIEARDVLAPLRDLVVTVGGGRRRVL